MNKIIEQDMRISERCSRLPSSGLAPHCLVPKMDIGTQLASSTGAKYEYRCSHTYHLDRTYMQNQFRNRTLVAVVGPLKPHCLEI